MISKRAIASVVFMTAVFSAIFLIRWSMNADPLTVENIGVNSWPEERMPEKKSLSYLKFIEDIKIDFLENHEDFLEINLEDHSIRLYRNGKLTNESEILASGDIQNWGGSAVGLYQVRSKNRASYSVSAELYMPHALHYYGKYYLHGEPYYPSGVKFESDFSGGCIRLADEEAKRLYDLAETGLPVLVIDKSRASRAYLEKEEAREFPVITAQNYLVADLDSGLILAEKNSKEVKPIASITKLMTAVVVAENINLENKITVHPSMLSAYGSIEGLEPEKVFRVVELFYPLLIESSNNAAEILTYFLGQKRTISLMNQKAESILMPDAYFADPHGLSDENISSARDIFQLTRYVFNNRPPLLEITRGRMVRSFGPVQFEIDQMWNKNIFADDLSFLGGKTGFILASRYTGTMIFKFLTNEGDPRNIAIIYLGSENAKGDVQRIYAWLMDNFSLTPFFP